MRKNLDTEENRGDRRHREIGKAGHIAADYADGRADRRKQNLTTDGWIVSARMNPNARGSSGLAAQFRKQPGGMDKVLDAQ